MQSARGVRGFASELNVAEVHVAFSDDIITFCLLGIFSHYYPIVPRSMSLCYMSCITAPVCQLFVFHIHCITLYSVSDIAPRVPSALAQPIALLIKRCMQEAQPQEMVIIILILTSLVTPASYKMFKYMYLVGPKKQAKWSGCMD